MKKLLLFLMAVMAFAGLGMAQDEFIYSAGYFKDEFDFLQSSVYINNSKSFHSSVHGYDAMSSAVEYKRGDVYWVKNVYDNGNFYDADLMKKFQTFMDSPIGEGRHIYDMSWDTTDYLGLFSAGCMDIDGVRTAVIWSGGQANIFAQLGDGVWPSIAYGCQSYHGLYYACGVQYDYGGSYHGVMWKMGSGVLHDFEEGTKIFSVCYHDASVWSVGIAREDGLTKLKVWRTDVNNGSTTVMYTLSNNGFDHPERTKIFVDDAGDIYVVGVTENFDRLYKNGVEIYNTPAYFSSVFVNSNGVYYAGSADDNGGYEGVQKGRVWKNGTLLLSPIDCEMITDIVVFKTECQNNEVRPLPYFEGFETGETDWVCWTVEDNSSNMSRPSYWHRCGENDFPPLPHYGHYCVWHPYGAQDEPQDDWLTSPLVYIPEGGPVKLTFETMETNVNSEYEYEGVWVVSDEGSVQVWNQPQEEASGEWKTVEIDLSNYQGQEIQIAFRYMGIQAHNWFIDNVNIEQVGAPVEFTITTEVVPNDAGTIYGAGTYPSGAQVTIAALANTDYTFDHWSDGVTTNPRRILVTGDAHYIAYFVPIAPTSYTITVESANPIMGVVSGGGTFLSGTDIIISAIPFAGYYFIGWDDGNADNPRTINVTQDATFIAQFASSPVQTFTLSVLSNSAQGTTVGSGTYTAGSTATIAAIPNSGYEFDKWNDNNTENPRQVVVNSDMTFVAFFKSVGVDENDGRLLAIYPNPAGDFIRIEGIEANSEVRIYNAMGALVKTANASADSKIGIGDLNAGIYLLRCGNASLRFVKE